jgi:hypothetical protein
MRQEQRLRWILVGVGVVIALALATRLVSLALYREENLAGREAAQRIAESLRLPVEVLGDAASATIRYRRAARLLRGGPVFMRFEPADGVVSEMTLRYGLHRTDEAAATLHGHIPPWWLDTDDESASYWRDGHLEMWRRESDGACFVLMRGG